MKRLYLGDIAPGESKEINLGDLPIHMNDINLKSITMTIKLKGLKIYRCRCWIAKQLIKISAKLMGIGIVIEDE